MLLCIHSIIILLLDATVWSFRATTPIRVYSRLGRVFVPIATLGTANNPRSGSGAWIGTCPSIFRTPDIPGDRQTATKRTPITSIPRPCNCRSPASKDGNR